MEIRTAIKHLQSTGEVTTNQQANNTQDNTNLTSNLTENQQANNTQLNKQVTGSILKEDKNIISKEINNNIRSNSDDLNETDAQNKKKPKLTEEENEELVKNFEIIYNSYPKKVG